VADTVDEALAALAAAGAQVEEAELPPFALFNACGRVLMAAEAFAVHEDALRTRPSDFGRYTLHRIAPAAGLGAVDLLQAGRARRELRTAVEQGAFARYDVLVTVSSLAPPVLFTDFGPDWPPPRAASATRTIPFNVTGHPAMSVPFGHSHAGLPLGVQIAGRFFGESTVLRVGRYLERVRPTRHLRPPAASASRVTRRSTGVRAPGTTSGRDGGPRHPADQ
jgi:aspartyl-tRNA(Asn)/glutamyl-tRNA(Gln) amidotransferase subunit A